MNNWDYPLGADNEDAPWNEKSVTPKPVEVTISMSISKTVKVYVDDYTVDKYGYDFSDCDIKQAVIDQIKLPDIKDWNLDEFEVVL